MVLVEKTLIDKSDKCFEKLDKLLFLSKNLYNSTLYEVRQHYFQTGQCLSYEEVNKRFSDVNHQDYKALPSEVAKMTQMLVEKNFKYFLSLSDRNKNEQYGAKVGMPKYLDKEKGKQTLQYMGQALKRSENGYVGLSGTDIWINAKKDAKFVRIIPKNEYINIEIEYEKECNAREKAIVASIDLGINNLGTVVMANQRALIINGKPLKSINQYYNKELIKEKSYLSKFKTDEGQERKTSNKIQRLHCRRNNKITDYMHKASRMIVNHLVSNGVSVFIIGYSKEWKQDINMNNADDQMFAHVPFETFVDMLTHKCLTEGINVQLEEESYTSKCSFFDNEDIKDHLEYQGKRVKRGLFQTSSGMLINADVNGALNILKKYCQKVAWNDTYVLDYVEACSEPIVLTIK